jgi:hypothetical protein
MRRSPLFRILSALLGMWFTVNFVAPESGMAGMVMGGSGVAMSASMDGMPAVAMANMPQPGSDQAPQKSTDSSKCDHHDCCCSAISPSLLTPQASLSWLPEHVIEQSRPQVGTNVLYSDGQLLLPFANGPPNSLIA